jgi:hypothetical protein
MTTQAVTAQSEIIRARLNSETAKLGWSELQRFFAAGKILHVDTGLDLIEVAFTIQQDEADKVQLWMDRAKLGAVSDQQAKLWIVDDQPLWTVVVKPWVLVQVPRH